MVDNEGAEDSVSKPVTVEYTLPCEVNFCKTYSNHSDLTIPNNDWLRVKRSINVYYSGDFGVITVNVKINHKDAEQLSVMLRAPNGTKW